MWELLWLGTAKQFSTCVWSREQLCKCKCNAPVILSCNTECTVEYVFALICLSKAGQLVNEGDMTVEDFLESNHQLTVQQQTAREEEEDRADDMEAEELNNLRQVLY